MRGNLYEKSWIAFRPGGSAEVDVSLAMTSSIAEFINEDSIAFLQCLQNFIYLDNFLAYQRT